MNIRIAILAACASALSLTQADVARADHGAVLGSTSFAGPRDGGPKPMIVVAQQNAPGTASEGRRRGPDQNRTPTTATTKRSAPGGGVRWQDEVVIGRQHPGANNNSAIFDRWGNAKTPKSGVAKGSRGVSDNESPRPQGR